MIYLTNPTSISPGHIIQDEGVSLTTRSKLNFVGAGVTVTDGGAGTDDTIVTIPSGGGSPASPVSSVQFNDAGVFGGDSLFTFTKATKRLALGVATPLTRLHVSNSGSNTISPGVDAVCFVDSGTASYNSEFKGSGSFTGFIVTNTSGGGMPFVQFYNSNTTKIWTHCLETDKSFTIREGNAGGTKRLTILENGNTAIGNISPLTTFDVNGDILGRGDVILNKGGGGVVGPYLYIESLSSGPVDSEFGFFCAGKGSGNNSDGPYFGMRGNLFTRTANQRGYMFFVAGNPTGTLYDNDGMLAFQATTDVAFVSDGNQLLRLSGGNISGTPYGITSVSAGVGSVAGGSASVSIGYYSTASNTQSTAIGNQCNANGVESISIGGNAVADNWKSLSIGNNCAAYGSYDMVLGTGIYVGTTNSASTMVTAGDAGTYSPYLSQDNTFMIFGADLVGADTNTYNFKGGVGVGDTNNITVTNLLPNSVWTVCGSLASMTIVSDVDYYLGHYDCKLILITDNTTAFLPSAATCCGREYSIKSRVISGNVYIATQFGEMLDDGNPLNPYPVKDYECYTVFSDGRNWYFRSMYRP